MHVRALAASLLAGAAIASFPHPAEALDKQGSAHGGKVESGDDSGFNVSGAATLGTAIINKSYAARPDNTGLALFRYAGHADIDLIGRKLSIPLDVNLFTDKTQRGLRVFRPSELDLIGGVTTTQPFAKGDVELGARAEHDGPADRGGFSQTYVDARARYLYSLAKWIPSLGHDLDEGDLSGNFALGWFAVNPSYAARPDNSGRALFRYIGHSELSVWHDYVSIGLDATFFTDRRSNTVIAPSECDLTYEFIVRTAPFEVHLAYERDMPLDERSLIQDYVFALFVYGFDLKRKKADPLETRGTIPSP